jgi:hypothetical protein
MAMKPKAKAKANVSKDYMKPVGGTKQEGYVKPGGNLFDVKADRKYVTSKTGLVTQQTRRTGRGVGQPKLGMRDIPGDVPTGINPKAMKATAGNPKPTTSQLATAKKKADAAKKNKTMETQAQKKKNTKPAKGSTKGATLKNPKPTASPSTGRYKRNP